MSNEQLVIKSLEQIQIVLRSYHSIGHSLNLTDFILPAVVDLQMHGRVIFQEDMSGDFLIGLQFGVAFVESLSSYNNVTELPLHQLCILAEELSHFNLLCDAYANQSQLSALDIEVMGEVDRFLALLAFAPKDWRNLHDACDAVMQGAQRFSGSQLDLYIKAEGIAFKHLQQAFSHCWNSSHFDFAKIDQHAKQYVQQLRSDLLGQKPYDTSLSAVA